jgi:DNA-binding LytR/AlgR family response regulator
MKPVRVLIIEDEIPAQQRLGKMLAELMPQAQLEGMVASVEEACDWLEANAQPDLILSDIQLSDGLSFDIFKVHPVSSHIIFTTAYDQYAIRAFKLNSIDYLLKPLKKEEMEQALNKFSEQTRKAAPDADWVKSLVDAYIQPRPVYKSRFTIKIGEQIKILDASGIAYAMAEQKMCFFYLADGTRLPSDHTLDELEELLDPAVYFRVNRQYLVNISAIETVTTYSKSRLVLKLKPVAKTEVMVSTERSASFKKWLAG